MSKLKSVFMIMTFCAAMCVSSYATANDGIMLEYDGGVHSYSGELYDLFVNEKKIDPPLEPIIFNDRALVPVREIFEEVGAEVSYDGDSQSVEVFTDDTYIRMNINDNIAYVNGSKTAIPDNVVPKLISKVGGETKTMVPVRFISETIGMDVNFDGNGGAILIKSNDFTDSVPEETEPPITNEEIQSTEEPIVTEAPVVTAEPKAVESVNYEITGERSLKVTVETNGAYAEYSDFILSAPSRLVVDFTGFSLRNEFTEKLNKSGFNEIRTGDNGERARIVVEMSTGIDGYNITRLSDTKIEINVTSKEGAPVVTPTQVPSQTASPTHKPSPNTGSNQSVNKKLIVLDAGHGGTDSGAVGYLNGNAVLEKNLTLEITNRVKRILEENGYTVSMTRTGDTLPSLVERPTQANNENAAIFVSIHINSVDGAPSANGTEIYYSTENNGTEYGTSSSVLAKNILDRMIYHMGSTNRGVKTANHAVTRRANMPASLVEVGFISNATELYNMTTEQYQEKAALGIAEGIMMTVEDIK